MEGKPPLVLTNLKNGETVEEIIFLEIMATIEKTSREACNLTNLEEAAGLNHTPKSGKIRLKIKMVK
ncbi:unnamed protein product [Rhizophagus irregularis]|nr:unnamed protein product [Rhizophagus irregularis]